MKLSIIVTYYNTPELTKKLIEKLNSQLTNETELLIVDDGCHETFNARTIHIARNSKAAGKPRNIGIENTKGKYITFIDSDDIISDDYVTKIIKKIDSEEFDYCLFSWQFLNSKEKVIIEDNPPKWNCSIWNCIYKRDLIGTERFNETMRIAEDHDFNLRVRKGKKANIEDILYFYNEGRKGSLMNG